MILGVQLMLIGMFRTVGIRVRRCGSENWDWFGKES